MTEISLVVERVNRHLKLKWQRNQRSNLPASTGSLKKQANSRKISTFASLTTLKPFTVWITTKYGKFLMREQTREMSEHF